jgi:hypothetical protein
MRCARHWVDLHAGQFELFLHAFDNTALEKRMLAAAARVCCGNRELSEQLKPTRPDIVELFCPGTLLNPERFDTTELSVFTFGMAHKIRVPLYRRLRDLLEATGKTYSVYVSTALHENTSFDDSFVVRFEELQSIFNRQVYFMGYLSDTAVFNHLVDCTFVAAFFEKGLRANNTTVNAAMEVGVRGHYEPRRSLPRGPRPHEERDRHQSVRLSTGCGRGGNDWPRGARHRARGLRVGPAGRAAASCRPDIGGA